MIVVALGIGWAAVDLDVKRLELYFQLLGPGEQPIATRYFFTIFLTSLLLCPSTLLEEGACLVHIHPSEIFITNDV